MRWRKAIPVHRKTDYEGLNPPWRLSNAAICRKIPLKPGGHGQHHPGPGRTAGELPHRGQDGAGRGASAGPAGGPGGQGGPVLSGSAGV